MENCLNCGRTNCDGSCVSFNVRDKVYDSLTRQNHYVTKIESEYLESVKQTVQAVYIDSDYLGGARFPWELIHIKFMNGNT